MTTEYNQYMAEKYAKINAKLKPCRLCGGVAKMWQDPMGTELKKVVCDKCGIGTLWDYSESRLLGKWNKQEEVKMEIEL